MAKASKVERCVLAVKRSGKSKVAAIRICQASTGESLRRKRRKKRKR